MNQLIFCFNPRDEDQFEDAYMLINALLQASQGTLVAILYCFTNTQVKATVKAAYCRRIMLRDVHSVRINNHHNTNNHHHHHNSSHHQSTIIRKANSKRNVTQVEATTIDINNGVSKSKKVNNQSSKLANSPNNVKLSVNVPLTTNCNATTSIV